MGSWMAGLFLSLVFSALARLLRGWTSRRGGA